MGGSGASARPRSVARQKATASSCACILRSAGGRHGAKQIISAWTCAVPEQQPGRGPVLNSRNALEQPVMLITLELQLSLDVRLIANTSTQNDEA